VHVRMRLHGAIRLRQDVDARSDAHLHQSFDLERDQRFPDARPRYAQLLGEVALRRQPRAGGKLARAHERADLVGDLPVEAARLDAVQRHEGKPDPPRATGAARRGPKASVVPGNWSSGNTNPAAYA